MVNLRMGVGRHPKMFSHGAGGSLVGGGVWGFVGGG